jgi:hypothetical protein
LGFSLYMKKRYYLLLLVFLLLTGIGFARRAALLDWWQQKEQDRAVPVSVSFNNAREQTTLDTDENTADVSVNNNVNISNDEQPDDTTPDVSLPLERNLDIPFTSQAPHGDWSLPFKEACEEASLIMVHYYLQEKILNPDQATQEIQDMSNWQLDEYGDYIHSDTLRTAEIARKYYGYDNVEVITDITVQDIKNAIAEGYPVIVPAAGRKLGNPNFTAPGPIYHMLVVRGYTATGFITNDPGTRNGRNYFYTTDTLMNALADWTGEDAIGPKMGIIIRI